jgi:hypothetical protein
VQKWEYKVVYVRNLGDAQGPLDMLGAEGWELVCVDVEDKLCFLKRPVEGVRQEWVRTMLAPEYSTR